MLFGKLLHPQILYALGTAGHGATVLIADGNYPFVTRSYANAEKVYLNLAPGLLNATDVLEVLTSAIPIEAAHVMTPDDGSEPSIFADFRRILPDDLQLQVMGRWDFYDKAKEDSTALVIATAEQRIYANILLTIGVVPPPE